MIRKKDNEKKEKVLALFQKRQKKAKKKDPFQYIPFPSHLKK